MSRELISLRLDPVSRRRLAVASRRRSRSVSELMRTAIAAWLDHEEETAKNAPHDAMADLVGIVRSGDADRSTRATPRPRRLARAKGNAVRLKK